MDANHTTCERAGFAVNLERLVTIEEEEKAKSVKKASGLVGTQSTYVVNIPYPTLEPGTFFAGSWVLASSAWDEMKYPGNRSGRIGIQWLSCASIRKEWCATMNAGVIVSGVQE